MADPQYGPRVTVTRSCADCKACKTESYACQGDSGIDWYCAHPTHEKRRYIGISSATPEWCPAPRGVTPCQTEQECEVPNLCRATGGCERMEPVCSRGCPAKAVCKAILSGDECTAGLYRMK